MALNIKNPEVERLAGEVARPDALTVQDGRYRLIDRVFPFEGMGSAANRDELMRRALDWLGGSIPWDVYFPLLRREVALP